MRLYPAISNLFYLFFISFVSATPLLAADSQTITIKDFTRRGFSPDLVNYTIDTPKDGAKNLRISDALNKPLPVQLTLGENGKSTISFVAGVAPGKTATFTLRTDDNNETAPPAVFTMKEGNTLVLANQNLAVKVPEPREMTFDKAVAADTLPAPILAFRSADGAWKGEGEIISQRSVKKYTVKQIADGPVFCMIRYRLDYIDGGWYEATVRVTDRSPLAEIREEYDLGQIAAKNTEFWQIDLSRGWNANESERMNVAGQGFSPVKYTAIEQEENIAVSGPSAGDGDFSGGLMIHHDSCWGSRFVSYYGIHKAEERKTHPDSYEIAMVAPLHKGEWRRANSLPVVIKDRQVRILFPMDTAPVSWKTDPGSDTSPFAVFEHDPALPASYTRRVWGLVLAHPSITVTPDKSLGSVCPGYSVRNLYGTIGLDRYKDFVLNWQDGVVTYPRVFITPDKVKKYRDAVKADPNFALAIYDNLKNPVGIKNFYILTGDTTVVQQEINEVIKSLDEAINYHISSLAVPHHHALGMWGLSLAHTESVLSWPDLPVETRSAIRSRLALLCYLLIDPDITSAGNGSHTGNPNMGIARLSDRSNLVALIPDHPMHTDWAKYTGDFLAYKMGTFMAPEGAWNEYGVSYHMHGYGKIERGMMGTQADKVASADQIWKYNRQDFDYFLNLLTPVDPRFGSRLIPGMANSPTGNPIHLLQAMGTVADRDPDFAANLRWGWEAGGQMVGTGADSITIPAMARPEIPAKAPRLTSRIYPGFGVIFRAHQGPDETCLYLRSGYHWSHWDTDQGNIICYAKGAPLLPPQPYQYARNNEINAAFPDKNIIRFGDPKNNIIHAWPDSNILDAAFGDSVDFAWHSTGYPDWFFTPGGKPGFSNIRPRAEVDGTADGAFNWDRQVSFLKSPNAKGPNYFVIRDSVNGPGKTASWFNLNIPGTKNHLSLTNEKVSVDTEWPTKLDLLFPGRQKLPFDMSENRLPTLYREDAYFKFSRTPAEGEIISRDYIIDDEIGTPIRWEKWTGQRKKNPAIWDYFISIAHNPAHTDYLKRTFAFDGMLNVKHQQVTLRLQNSPGQDISWIIYPRGDGEIVPIATQPAPGVTKVVTNEGTDYIFLSTTPFDYTGDDVIFHGCAGAVRIGKDGKTTLVLSSGPGKVGYKDAVIDSAVPFQKTVTGKVKETITAPIWKVTAAPQPVTVDGDKIRFVMTECKYVELTHGNVGVRGSGPFDLTFTPTEINGTVDGSIRTIVCTWPEKIVRPGYRMDGVRWYAGFADESSINKKQQTPQFSLAFGVSSGPHTIKISEWEWPMLSPIPARTVLTPQNFNL